MAVPAAEKSCLDISFLVTQLFLCGHWHLQALALGSQSTPCLGFSARRPARVLWQPGPLPSSYVRDVRAVSAFVVGLRPSPFRLVCPTGTYSLSWRGYQPPCHGHIYAPDRAAEATCAPPHLPNSALARLPNQDDRAHPSAPTPLAPGVCSPTRRCGLRRRAVLTP